MCFSPLMSVAVRYKKNQDDAAFLANEAFMKILKNIDKIDCETSIIPWIKRIMINTAIDDFRRNKRSYDLINIESLEVHGIDSPEAPLELDYETSEYFQHILNQLPTATSHVFNLYAIDGYSHKEIAENLAISAETSKWHVKEARKRLRIIYNQKQKKDVG